MTNKQTILKYLDRMCHNIPITGKRIAHYANKNEVMNLKVVSNIMGKLVEAGEWESIPTYSMDGTKAYRRVKKL